MASLNVLITAGSRRVPLVQAFRRALRELGLDGAVITADVNRLSPAVYLADRAYWVPLSTDPCYLEEIHAICSAENIGLLIPTIDEELPVFGGARRSFALRGVQVFTSSQQTAETCWDKFETTWRLRASGVSAVESFVPATLPSRPPLPLFVKPRFGRGSVRAFTARTRQELEFFQSYVDDPVIQRHLDGPEFTIDMLCDLEGCPLSVVPRERVVIRAGVSDRGRTVRDDRLIDLALECAKALDFVGAVNIQCRMVGDHPVIFEINPRFSGGIPLTLAAGADFPRMMIEMTLGRQLSPRIGDFKSDLYMTSYESAVFLESWQVSAAAPRVTHPLREAV